MKTIHFSLLLITAVFTFLVAPHIAYAVDDTITLPDGRTLELNSYYMGQGYIVYGSPEDVIDATPGQSQGANGQPRYFGYSMYGVPYSNPGYQNDTGAITPADREYIIKPWLLGDTGCYPTDKIISNEDWPLIYDQIKAEAVRRGYPADAFPNEMSYYGSLSPSINGLTGSLKVIFKHKGSSADWERYETLDNLIVKFPDYYVQFAGSFPQEFTPGQTINLNFYAGQLINYEFSFLKASVSVYMVANSQVNKVFSRDMSFGVGTETINFSVTMPDAENVKLIAVINKDDLNGIYIISETNYDNNVHEITLKRTMGTPGNPQEELPPYQPPADNSNLKAVSIELLNKDMTPHSGDIVVNTPYKVRAKFTSTFNEGGWVKLRLYSWKEAGWMDEKISEYIYMQPNSSIEKVWDYNGGLGKTTLYSSINYRYGDSWIGEAYNSIMETDYSDNYCSLSRGGAGITDRPPEATGFEYSLYYHPMKLHEEPIIEKQPVYGWKMVDFIKGDDDTKFWVGSRLVFPDQVDIDR